MADNKTEFFDLTHAEVRLLLLSIVCPKRIEQFDFAMLGKLVNTASATARADYFNARRRLNDGVDNEVNPKTPVPEEVTDDELTPTKSGKK
ncbi:hypothetical protein N7454_000731 [Penicillium verhagenii]|nr:hypothetical protein N7454_000731 [Penicillium verhagenii]